MTVIDGPDAARETLRLVRVMQDRPTGPLSWSGEELDEQAFLARMTQERRVIYEFEPTRAYGSV